MEEFAKLLDRLYYTHSNLAKSAIIREYLNKTPNLDRGFAIAAIAGELRFDLFKRSMIKDIIKERVDPVLYDMSRDYVGETSETVAHLWTKSNGCQKLKALPKLSEVIEKFTNSTKQEIHDYFILLMDNMTSEQRWALLKLGTRGLRVGVSARFIKKTLAEYAKDNNQNIETSDVESVWHALKPPYLNLFDWIEGKADKPDTKNSITFHPVMLSHPLDAETELAKINPQNFIAEWKYDGIRVQVVSSKNGKALFSRTGDDISHSFPDFMESVNFNAVIDGELIVKKNNKIASFNELQQRLNKKKPSKKLMDENPAHLIIYDILELNGEELTSKTLLERRNILKQWLEENNFSRIEISKELKFKSIEDLKILRDDASSNEQGFVEGLMLKDKNSLYVPGRPKGKWYKWKRDPKLIDAILMYAQRGSGKRSSYYSDYTFGLWKSDNDIEDESEILPIGKAYSGFTDEELKKLDAWVRNNTTNRFGPVREVKKELVFEVAFDSVNKSKRHKSGYALRFPRINRIRWDKPAKEADILENLEKLQ